MSERTHGHQQSSRQKPASTTLARTTTSGITADADAISRALAEPGTYTLSPSMAQRLQRTHGNQFVQRLIQPATRWNAPGNNLLELADTQAESVDSTPPTHTPPHLRIQRVWSDVPLHYATIRQEKNDGQIRTGKWKFNSVEDWVKKFVDAVIANKAGDVRKALTGLRERLVDDRKDAANNKLKKPKGVRKEDFNKNVARGNAAVFFSKWINVVDEHIQHVNAGGSWLADFRMVYAAPVMVIDTEESDEEEDSTSGSVTVLSPRDQFLENLETLEDTNEEQKRGLTIMYDNDAVMRARLQAIVGGDPNLAKMHSFGYVLEAIVPGHFWSDNPMGSAQNTFSMWLRLWDYGMQRDWTQFATEKLESSTDGKVNYIADMNKEDFRLTPSGKKLLDARGAPIIGDTLYVLSAGNAWYGAPDGGNRRHSSFLQGVAAICAGHMQTDGSGNLLRIDNNSGHYAPSKENLKNAVRVLKNQMDTSDVSVGGYGMKGGSNVDTFLQS